FKSYPYNGNFYRLIKNFYDEKNFFVLESSLLDKDRGRYSYLGFDPFHVFSQNGKNALVILEKEVKPFSDFCEMCENISLPGIVGYLGYNFGLKQENIPARDKDSVPDTWFGFYDCVLKIDHFLKKLYVYSSGFPEQKEDLREKRAWSRINYVEHKLKNIKNYADDLSSSTIVREGFETGEALPISNFNREEYCSAVNKILRYIQEGDVYQVNLAQKFVLDASLDKKEIVYLYQLLQQLSPGCFGGFLDAGDFQVLSSSPERFFKIEGKRIQARPMKGTRPRGKSLIEDQDLKTQLISSEKDKAELLMITDLMRNDLGRVCRYGSVKVKDLRVLEEYKTVYQTTSCVEGILEEKQTCFEVLKQCFPGGSITGCPKIRAMEIIEELEPSARDLYTGCFGYISFNGDADFNILIRTILASPNQLTFHVGSGVVADSRPEIEYQESLVKAKAMMAAVTRAITRKPIHI
ncbi:MAG: anthranilate synthase component I family protein, partial [Candidatus Omnitrophica bacterium]|nr:anthranilate synthase component I family protein [Candidatus Omnitrophota bacterium]